MDVKQLLSDIITFKISSFVTRWHKLQARTKRSKTSNDYTKVNYTDIPVIINNYNRLTYLTQLIQWLEKAGMKNIYIIDNLSTYPPLLKFYSQTSYKVFRLQENIGYLALWKTKIFDQFKSGYFIYTDSDVVPVESCRLDAVKHFKELLEKYTWHEKAGFGLKTDDLPDSYSEKQKVIEWEQQFWKTELEKDVFDAPIDTTFALYKPYTNHALWAANSLRTAGNYMARHLPWYENSSNDSEETIFYKQHIKQGASHWIKSN